MEAAVADSDTTKQTPDLLDVLLNIHKEDDPASSLTTASIKAVILVSTSRAVPCTLTSSMIYENAIKIIRLARRLGPGSASPDDRTLLLRNDEHRVRQDIQANRSTEDHTLHVCRKVPSGCDGTGALSPSRHDRARTVLQAPTFVLQCCGRRHQPSDADPDISIRQPLQSRRELASSKVMDV